MKSQRISQDHPAYRRHVQDRRREYSPSEDPRAVTRKRARSVYEAGYFYKGLQQEREEVSEDGEQIDTETFSQERITGYADRIRALTDDPGFLQGVSMLVASDRAFVGDLVRRRLIKDTSSITKDAAAFFKRRGRFQDDRHKRSRLERAEEITRLVEDAKDEIVLEVAARTVEIVEQRREQAERVFPEMKRRFLKRIAPLIRSRRYPITQLVVEERMKDLSVVVDFPNNMNEAGNVNHEDTRVFLSVFEVNESSMEHTIMHELMHVVTGKIIHVELDENGEGEEYWVAAYGLDEVKDGRHQSRWLTEAWTERETMGIMDLDEGSYSGARALSKALQLGGKFFVPDRVFLDALFFSSGEYEEDEIAHDLMKRSVDKSFTPGFFDSLQASLKMMSVERVAALLQQNRWREVYNIGKKQIAMERKVDNAFE